MTEIIARDRTGLLCRDLAVGKIYPGLSHGMAMVGAERTNADLLASIQT